MYNKLLGKSASLSESPDSYSRTIRSMSCVTKHAPFCRNVRDE
jgi:hypothetical protein